MFLPNTFRIAYHTDDNGLRFADWVPDQNSLLPVRTYTVLTRPAPFEIVLTSHCAAGDIDANGTVDIAVLDGEYCRILTDPISAGSAGGVGGFSFTASALLLAPYKRTVTAYNGTLTTAFDSQTAVSAPSEHGIDGAYSALPLHLGSNYTSGFIAAGPADASGGLKHVLYVEPNTLALLRNGFEEADLELFFAMQVLNEAFDLEFPPAP
jgi:hypothetical protein